MQAGVPPMPATVGGLLAAADEISGLSDNSGATLDQRSPAGDTPVDEPTERPSWSLPQGSAKQNAKPDEHNKSAAKRELNRASTILSEFDVAAADAWSVLKEIQNKKADATPDRARHPHSCRVSR